MRPLTLGLNLGLVVMLSALISGCGEATKPKPSETPAANTPATKPADKAGNVAEKKPATDPQDMASDETEPEPEPEPKDPADMSREELLGSMIELLQSGIVKRQLGDDAGGFQAIRESVVYLTELRKRFPELTSLERRILSRAYVFQARAFAQEDDPKDAVSSIGEAVALGFDDFDRLDKEADLAKLREQPDYAQWRKGWETKALELVAAEIPKELEEFKSFDFDFALPDLDEKEVKLADFKGKVVIVDFWGTWCPPCQEEIPSFMKLQTKYADEGLQIVGLNYEDSDETSQAIATVREFMESQPINYPCLIGDAKTREQVPEFSGFPTTLFIDRTGKVRLVFFGLHSYGRLEAAVQALLKEPST